MSDIQGFVTTGIQDGPIVIERYNEEPSLKTAAGRQKPFQQGDMDGLCGLYSLLNSARCADPSLHVLTCKAMFRESLGWLQLNGYLPDVLYSGVPVKALLSLHKRVIRKRRPGLKLKRPFIQSRPTSNEEFWAAMAGLVTQPGRALLVGMFSRSWSHWTVIRRITARQVFLFDSGDLHWFRPGNCTCSRDKPAAYFIDPAEVFLIEAGKGRQNALRCIRGRGESPTCR